MLESVFTKDEVNQIKYALLIAKEKALAGDDSPITQEEVREKINDSLELLNKEQTVH